jgi:hypothetical protein
MIMRICKPQIVFTFVKIPGTVSKVLNYYLLFLNDVVFTHYCVRPSEIDCIQILSKKLFFRFCLWKNMGRVLPFSRAYTRTVMVDREDDL